MRGNKRILSIFIAFVMALTTFGASFSCLDFAGAGSTAYAVEDEQSEGPASVAIDSEKTDEDEKNNSADQQESNGKAQIVDRTNGSESEADEHIYDNTLVKTIKCTDGIKYKVTASYDDETGIPADAKLSIKEVKPDTKSYDKLCNKSDKIIDDYKEENGLTDDDEPGQFTVSTRPCTILDIKIVNDKGDEYQPKKGTTVNISIAFECEVIEASDRDEDAISEEVPIVHVNGKGKAELIEGEVETSGSEIELNFDTPSFSQFIIDFQIASLILHIVLISDELNIFGIVRRKTDSPSSFVPIVYEGENKELYEDVPNMKSFGVQKSIWASTFNRYSIPITDFSDQVLAGDGVGSENYYTDKYSLLRVTYVPYSYKDDIDRIIREANAAAADPNNPHEFFNNHDFSEFISPGTGVLYFSGRQTGQNDERLSNDLREHPWAVMIFQERDTNLVLTNSSSQAITFKVALTGNKRDARYGHNVIANGAANGTTYTNFNYNLNNTITLAPNNTLTLTVPTGHGDGYTITQITPNSKGDEGQTPIVYGINPGDGGETAYGFASMGLNSDGSTVGYTSATAPNYTLSHTYNRTVTFYDGDNVNGLKAICKIRKGTTMSYPFLTLKSAILFTKNRMENKTSTIEMLVDYTMPATDIATIDSGCKITLTTAKTDAPDGFIYNGQGNATITRGFSNNSSMIDVAANSSVTLQDITLDGDKSHYSSSASTGGILYVRANGSAAINSGAVLQNAQAVQGGAARVDGTMTMSGNALIDNCRSSTTQGGDGGGGIYILNGGTVTMTDSATVSNCTSAGGCGGIKVDGVLNLKKNSKVTGCTAVNGGGIRTGQNGKVYIEDSPTISGNRASDYGAGLYLKQGSRLYIQGSPSFSDNICTRSGIIANNSKNGGENYTQAKQDIFVLQSDTACININGPLTSGDGSIWVWCETSNLYQQDKVFAKYSSGVTESSANAFRNARTDSQTSGGIRTEYLTGIFDPTSNSNIKWGPSESRVTKRVVLRKTLSGSTKSGAEFYVYKSDGTTFATDASGNPVNPKVGNNYQKLTSKESGVFWIGNLKCGHYIIKETSPYSTTFELIVEADGVTVTEVD